MVHLNVISHYASYRGQKVTEAETQLIQRFLELKSSARRWFWSLVVCGITTAILFACLGFVPKGQIGAQYTHQSNAEFYVSAALLVSISFLAVCTIGLARRSFLLKEQRFEKIAALAYQMRYDIRDFNSLFKENLLHLGNAQNIANEVHGQIFRQDNEVKKMQGHTDNPGAIIWRQQKHRQMIRVASPFVKIK